MATSRIRQGHDAGFADGEVDSRPLPNAPKGDRPVDGISFRPPIATTKKGIGLGKHRTTDAGIYDEPNRSGYAVRVRIDGKLYYFGVFVSLVEARLARDVFKEKMASRASIG